MNGECPAPRFELRRLGIRDRVGSGLWRSGLQGRNTLESEMKGGGF